jgi:hypothetical protein
MLDEINRRIRNGDLGGSMLQSGKLRLRERHRLAAVRAMPIVLCSGGANKSNEAGVSDIADTKSEQEPIPERFEFICSLSRDGLMDARLSVVVIEMILSLICPPLSSFYLMSRQEIASQVARADFSSRY